MDVMVEKIVSRGDIGRFIRLSADLYRHDPYWVKPLPGTVLVKLDPRRNPFFEHSEVQPFLAWREDRPVGHIAAILNHRHNETHSEKAAFFGFFECREDPEAARALLEAVGEWAFEKGASFLRGPAPFSTGDAWGLLVKGFDSSPLIGMPYNPPYYSRLLESTGFVKEKDLFACHLDIQKETPAYLQRTLEHAGERTKVTVRTLRPEDFEEEIRTLQDIHHRTAEKRWGFVPMTENEIVRLAAELKPLYLPGLVLIAEIKGRPVGCAVCLPDENQVLRPLGRGLLPAGLTRLFADRRKITAVRFLALDVLREHRPSGIAVLLYREMLETLRRRGYLDAEFFGIPEDDAPMRHIMERIGTATHKTYRIYRKELS